MRAIICKVKIRLALIFFCLLCALPAQESYLGNLAEVIRSIHSERGFPMAFENRKGLSVAEWRKRGRDEIRRTMSYWPRETPLDLKVHSRAARRGYELRVVSFAGSPHYRIPAFLLIPDKGKPPFPAIAALHDHGGYFYHGKEKLVEVEPEHAALTDFKKRSYGGRSWASDLARRGFVVLVIDAFYWGDRRLQHQTLPSDFRKVVEGLDPNSIEYVRAVNRYLSDRAEELQTWSTEAGTNWMGIIVHDDIRSVDLLASLPEVDKNRIGCAGLSVGGYRATYLAGMDSRIRAAVIVGWMTSLATTLDLTHAAHGSLPDLFGLHASLDHPDIASLAAPACAMFVQNCAQDRLFTRAGMEQAAEKIRRVFGELKHPEKYRAQFYDAPHQFNVAMQEDAFEWLRRWLGR